MTFSALLEWGISQLKNNWIDDFRLEAEILLLHILQIEKSVLIVNPNQEITPDSITTFNKLIERRTKHEPTAYITGHQPFMSFDFFVDPSVLIPRPETELLVESALDALRPGSLGPFLIADLGAGSGVIAICLAKLVPSARVFGIDFSEKALEVARKNSIKHQVSNRCHFLTGNLFEPLKEKKVDLIISNPPYIPTQEIERLQSEVRDWEPRQALDGGIDGLDCIRQIMAQAPAHLNPGGKIMFEFGINQAGKIKELAERNFSESRIIKDYAGIDRIFLAESKSLQD